MEALATYQLQLKSAVLVYSWYSKLSIWDQLSRNNSWVAEGDVRVRVIDSDSVVHILVIVLPLSCWVSHSKCTVV